MEHTTQGLFALLGIGILAGAIAGIDWLFAQKYKTKAECEECRSKLIKDEQNNRDLLIKLNTKVDLLLSGKNVKFEDE